MNTRRNKMIKTLVKKSIAFKSAVTVALYVGLTDIACAQMGSGTASTTNLSSFMSGILSIMPMASKIAGASVFIGGLWAMYKHFKSQGRDGSVAAGVAGVLIGAGLFFIGGLLSFGAGIVGFDQNTTLPN